MGNTVDQFASAFYPLIIRRSDITQPTPKGTSMSANPFNSRATLSLQDGDVTIYRLEALAKQGMVDLDSLPFSIRVLLENVLRHHGRDAVGDEEVELVAGWKPEPDRSLEVPFMPARVVLQDFTGVPAVVDLAAMRDAIVRLGGDPKLINPLVRTDLVIDHSVQVDFFGSSQAFELNVEREMERNAERYTLLRWAQQAFKNFNVVPPGTGIVHQVNLEYLADVVRCVERNGVMEAFPDTLVGTDSHTTMINGLGVVGWGVGGIEAEAVMLGQPYFMLQPEVVGMRLSGALPAGATATDLVLRGDRDPQETRCGWPIRGVLWPRPTKSWSSRPRHHRKHVTRIRRNNGVFPG